MKKVLIVEDREEFMNAAKKFFSGQNVEAIFVNSYEEAEKLMASNNFDEALIDVFMPSSPLVRREAIQLLAAITPDDVKKSGGDYDRFLASVQAIMDDSAEAPVGLLLYSEAKKLGIAAINVTSLWHHATKFEAIYRFIASNGGKFHEGTEGSNYEADKESSKNCPEFWKKAYGHV